MYVYIDVSYHHYPVRQGDNVYTPLMAKFTDEGRQVAFLVMADKRRLAAAHDDATEFLATVLWRLKLNDDLLPGFAQSAPLTLPLVLTPSPIAF